MTFRPRDTRKEHEPKLVGRVTPCAPFPVAAAILADVEPGFQPGGIPGLAHTESNNINRLFPSSPPPREERAGVRLEPKNLVGTRSTASPSVLENQGRGGTRPYQIRKEVHGEEARESSEVQIPSPQPSSRLGGDREFATRRSHNRGYASALGGIPLAIAKSSRKIEPFCGGDAFSGRQDAALYGRLEGTPLRIIVAAEVTNLQYPGFPSRYRKEVRASLRRLLLFKPAPINKTTKPTLSKLGSLVTSLFKPLRSPHLNHVYSFASNHKLAETG